MSLQCLHKIIKMQIVWRRGVSEQPDMMEDVHITVMTVVPLTAPSLRIPPSWCHEVHSWLQRSYPKTVLAGSDSTGSLVSGTRPYEILWSSLGPGEIFVCVHRALIHGNFNPFYGFNSLIWEKDHKISSNTYIFIQIYIITQNSQIYCSYFVKLLSKCTDHFYTEMKKV